MSREEPVFDLVVIGGGIAGLTTATAAAEAGVQVCLVEKRPVIGGSSAMSGGWFAFSGTDEQAAEGIEDSLELFRRDLLETSGHLGDERLIEAYLRDQRATYEWLKRHGAVFREVEISSGQSARRGHNVDIKALLQDLHDAYEAAGGVTVFSAAARRLVTEEDRVTGVRVDTGAGSRTFYGTKGIVLASGGFSRSTDLLKVFAPEQLEAIPYGGAGNTGDGLRMAWKLGAGVADMSFVSGTYGSHPETTDDYQELLTSYYMGGIVVNRAGERFVDESKSYKILGRAVLQQPEGLGFQIFDADVRAQSHRGIALKDMDTLEDLGHIHSADSLEALAEVSGIDPEGLQLTVLEYNEAIRERGRDPLGRASLCNGVGELVPIEKAPFYSYPAKSLMTTTYCGLTVDDSSRVLDVFGDRIDGLFAVGEIIGGFHGAAYMTGTSLGKGSVFGYQLATRIASSGRES